MKTEPKLQMFAPTHGKISLSFPKVNDPGLTEPPLTHAIARPYTCEFEDGQ